MVNFSIIIPTFNRPMLALRAIKGVEKQMQKGDELLVIDNGSTESYEAVKAYIDERSTMRYLLSPSVGVSSARNVGIRQAKNTFIALLDDDDEWLSGHLDAHRFVYSKHDNIALVFSNFCNGSDDKNLKPNGVENWTGHKPDVRLVMKRHNHEDGLFSYHVGNIYREQLMADHVLPSAMSFSKNVVGKDIAFQEGLSRNESWLFSSNCSKKGDAAFIDASLVLQHAPQRVKRATAISAEDTMLSRLYVMSVLWARDKTFLTQHTALLNQWYFNDYYGLFRSALSTKDISLLISATKAVGGKTSIKYATRSILHVLRGRRPVNRNA